MFRWNRVATIQVREKSLNFVVGVGNAQKGLENSREGNMQINGNSSLQKLYLCCSRGKNDFLEK